MAKRAALVEMKSTVSGLIEEALGEIQSLGEEMRSWYDNMPESFQNGDRGSAVSESADALENIATEVDVPEEVDEEVTYTHRPLPRKISRAGRRDHAVGMLEAAKGKLEELSEAQDENEEAGEVDFGEIINELETIIDEASSVEFPGMYG